MVTLFLFTSFIIFCNHLLNAQDIVQCPTSTNECLCPVGSGECILNCNSRTLCKSHAITCRDNERCVVNCDGNGACRDATIQCPFTADCIVNCGVDSNVCNGLTMITNSATSYQCYGTDCPLSPPQYTIAPSHNPTTAPTTTAPTPPSMIPTTTPWSTIFSNKDMKNAAIGYSSFNECIYLLNCNNGIQIDITNHSRIYDEEVSVLPCLSRFDYHQYYTQLKQSLYILNGSHFLRFNLDTTSISALFVNYGYYAYYYPYDYPEAQYPYYPYPCLASGTVDNNDYLFIIGEGVQIVNMTTNVWLPSDDVPLLNFRRRHAGCIVSNNLRLYVFGGQYKPESTEGLEGIASDVTLKEVEFLDLAVFFTSKTNNILFVSLEDTLQRESYDIKSILYSRYILCVGGYNGNFIEDINAIDTISNTITIWDPLPSLMGQSYYPVGPIIYVDFRVYVFTQNYYHFMDLAVVTTDVPTKSPILLTNNPTINPSLKPTLSPTIDPSIVPSVSPSSAPTSAPSVSPTLFPTITDAYNSYLKVIYGLYNLSDSDIKMIANDEVNVLKRTERIIEEGYIHQHQVNLQYKDLWCRIFDAQFNGENRLHLEGNILCEKFKCNHLIANYDEGKFTAFMTEKLRNYFAPNTDASATQTLQFIVISMSPSATGESATGENKSKSKSVVDVIFYVSLILSFIFIIIAFIACCYNDGVCFNFPRCCGCEIVDDGRYIAIIVFTLHLYDIISDVNLSIEIWCNSNVFDNILLLMDAIFCTIFIIIPYVFNLYYAANIKKVIKENETAKSWFDKYSIMFTLLVALTGGCYPSLILISSNVFGAAVFSSGLTRYELKKMAKIRVFGNVILENIPQLILQILYVIAVQSISPAVMFAFIASILSVISTVLSYCIDRDDSDTKVIRYYLITKTDHDLRKDEENSINMNKGRRKRLSIDLAEVFGITPKNIHIGASTLTTYGFITAVMHFIYQNNAVSPQLYVDKLYLSLKDQVNKLFRSHFHLNNDFYVECHHKLSIKDRAFYKAFDHDDDDDDDDDNDNDNNNNNNNKDETKHDDDAIVDALRSTKIKN